MTTTTKTIREIQYLGPDGQPLNFVPGPGHHGHGQHQPPPVHPRLSANSSVASNYEHVNGPAGGGAGYPYHGHAHHHPGYGDYEQYGGAPDAGGGHYGEYPHRPPTPPSPSDRSVSPPPQHNQPGIHLQVCLCVSGRGWLRSLAFSHG